jgi:ribonuclease HI
MDSNATASGLTLYSDGSCHTQLKMGGWATILLVGGQKIVLSGTVPGSTNNRMEITAVIKGLMYVKEKWAAIRTITIFSDSQYVIGLPNRKEKLAASGFITKKGISIPNSDLVIELLEQLNFFTVQWVKIKAHQKTGNGYNYNREADQLSRRIVREAVRQSIS